MNQILYVLCKHSLDIMGGWHPFPSTCVAQWLNISLYKTRKEIKKLKEAGYVVSDMEVDTEYYPPTILRGYNITEKAKETQEYQQALKEAQESELRVFGEVYTK